MDVPRSIAVIDVGATNTKLMHLRADLSIVASRSRPVNLLKRPPYLQIDAEGVLQFAGTSIKEFDSAIPVDAIVTCTHGSALALLDRDGELAMPIMSYFADVPDDVARTYRRIEPEFAEVLAPTSPLALTLGRQLLWQETSWPEAFAHVSMILPYAQYIGFRLSGIPATEVSSLGAQTHLWAPLERRYASLPRARGWDRLFAPIRPAGEALGPARGLDLEGRGTVLCGLHDSNANFQRYQSLAPLSLLSTGTWIIAFDSAAPVDRLDGSRDQVANTTISGEPVACGRFMGGEEYARISGGPDSAAPSLSAVADLIASGTAARPSFTDSGGPVPQSGRKGRIKGTVIARSTAAASLASLYTAQMTALSLQGLGGTSPIVVDGVFGENDVFLGVLAALLPGHQVFASLERHGTTTGAASLAVPGPLPAPGIRRVDAPALRGLEAYHETWLKGVEAL